MTGIEKIVEKINEEAEAEYHRIVDDAKAQAQTVLSEAAEEARRSAVKVIEQAKRECTEIERRAVSMAGLEVRKMRLELKQALLQQAFDQALAILSSMPDAAYEDFLVTLASKAAVDGAELIFSEKDQKKLGNTVVQRVNDVLKTRGISVSLSSTTRNIPGGLIVQNGRIEVNCAFDILIDGQREELTAEVAKILF